VFVVICSLISSILYIFFAAFRYDKEGDHHEHEQLIVTATLQRKQDSLYLMFELVFVVHLITGFFQEFHPPGTLTPIRKLGMIFNHYTTGEFKYNLIPLIPLTEIL
jgi:C4-dicarboxylate transporter